MCRSLALALLAFTVSCTSASDPDADVIDGGHRVDGAASTDGAAPADDGGTPSVDGGTPSDGGTPPSTWARLPWEDCEGDGRIVEAGPDDYRDVLSTLTPGDTLRLGPGDYARGLPMRVSGEPGRCIVVEALDPSDRPRFLGNSAFNVLAIHGASWIKLRHLDVDIDGRASFGVASQGGTSMPTHHVVIEGIRISGFGTDQQIVGISTKSPAADWVIRGNHIEGAGTGLYLGNSDGRQPFIRGLIEHNTVLDPIGYAMQIKHQIGRPEGLPSEAETIIRHNAFAKTRGASTGGNARPNLLLGHFPPDGPGENDRYVVHGNLFYDNATENLLQAEGNLVIFNNVFVNPSGGAIAIQRHNGAPRDVDIFFNTVLATGRGIVVRGGLSGFRQRARFNAIFAGTPLDVEDTDHNIIGSYDDAIALRAPHVPAGEGLDPRPRDVATFTVEDGARPTRPEAAFDFDGRPRTDVIAGAFADATGAALTLTAPPIPD